MERCDGDFEHGDEEVGEEADEDDIEGDNGEDEGEGEDDNGGEDEPPWAWRGGATKMGSVSLSERTAEVYQDLSD